MSGQDAVRVILVTRRRNEDIRDPTTVIKIWQATRQSEDEEKLTLEMVRGLYFRVRSMGYRDMGLFLVGLHGTYRTFIYLLDIFPIRC